VVLLADGIPMTGAVVVGNGLEIEILDADPRKVKRVRITRIISSAEHSST